MALCWKRRFPGAIRPKKECIKSCEPCFAKNALNLNDKGPSIKWVCFPKFYGPLANWLWFRISPQSSLYVIYCLILLSDNNWWALPVFLCKLNLIKAHWGTGSRPFSFERLVTFLPQADHVLVDLLSSMVDSGGACSRSPPTYHKCPTFWRLWKTLKEQELSWATH